MTDQTIRRAYGEQLDAVHEAVGALGRQACEAVETATEVLLTHDLDGARRIVEGDAAINTATVDIEDRCTDLLVTQAPVAGDLRAVLSALRVANEIERCGDLAVNIAKTARRLHDVELAPRLRGMIDRMGKLAVGHLQFALGAYASADEGRAAALDDLDDDLDELHRDFVEELLVSRSSDAVDLRVAVQLALLGRYYERLGDHSVNIGERVRFRVSGWKPRFGSAAETDRRTARAPGLDLVADGVDGSDDRVDADTERRRVEALRRDFVANIGHELRTPVGALVVLAETLAQEVSELDDADAAATILRLSTRLSDEASRLGSTIDDLLELSRIEAGEPPVRTTESVTGLLEASRQRNQSAAALAGVDIVLRVPNPTVDVAVDRRQLVSALANLVDNAVKYSSAGSEVDLGVDVDPASIRFMVRDHGIGIPSADQSRIFERFYRVDRARRRDTGGTGLGLAIVRHVALNHGGSVSVHSVEGEGATFMLVIPRTFADEVDPAEVSATES